MVNEETKSKRNPLLLFLFAIVIPVILVLGLLIAILSISGIDVIGWTKDKGENIPVVSSFVQSKEEKKIESELTEANNKIKHQREEISDLQKEITSLEDVIEDLEMDITRLENRTELGVDESDLELDINEEVKQASSSFRKMDPEKAASIMQNLDNTTAVEILSQLSGKVRGAILAEMEPKRAADLTEEMMSSR